MIKVFLKLMLLNEECEINGAKEKQNRRVYILVGSMDERDLTSLCWWV